MPPPRHCEDETSFGVRVPRWTPIYSCRPYYARSPSQAGDQDPPTRDTGGQTGLVAAWSALAPDRGQRGRGQAMSSPPGSGESIWWRLRDRETRTGIWVGSELADLRGLGSDIGWRLASNRIVREATGSISQHSGASWVGIQAVNRESRLDVRMEDDGVGFNLLGLAAGCPRRGLALGLGGEGESHWCNTRD